MDTLVVLEVVRIQNLKKHSLVNPQTPYSLKVDHNINNEVKVAFDVLKKKKSNYGVLNKLKITDSVFSVNFVKIRYFFVCNDWGADSHHSR